MVSQPIETVRVAVYGVSLMMAVIEATLRTAPELTVMRVDPTAPWAEGTLQGFRPHVVIVDGNQSWPASCAKVQLRIAEAANNQKALLNHSAFAIERTSDLVAMIRDTYWSER